MSKKRISHKRRVAAPAATAVSFWRDSLLVDALVVIMLLVAMWSLSIIQVTAPRGERPPFAESLSYTPALEDGSPDAAVYKNLVSTLQIGVPYYEASARVLNERNAVSSHDVDTSTPLSHRLPTMYTLLALLPAHGLPYVLITLAVGSVGVIGSYVLARSYVTAPVAAVSAGSVAVYYGHVANSLSLFGTEVWAGALGLACIAVTVRAARATGSQALWLSWGAAALAVLAASVRELSVAFLIVGTIAVVSTAGARAARLWLPWVAGWIVVIVGYGVHVASTLPWLTSNAASSTAGTWFAPDGSGLVAGVVRTSWFLAAPVWATWCVVALGVAGGLMAQRAGRSGIAVALATTGGVIALALMHPPGAGFQGTPPGYWSDLVMPTLITCAPLVLAWWSPIRSWESGA